MDVMQSSCEEVALRNVSLWKPDPSGNGTLEPPMEIGNSLCPGQCNGNGNCVNATCICNKGYTSSDCSIKANARPKLHSIPLNGLCDKRARDCKRTRIVGSNFVDSENLTCRITEVKVCSTLKLSHQSGDFFIMNNVPLSKLVLRVFSIHMLWLHRCVLKLFLLHIILIRFQIDRLCIGYSSTCVFLIVFIVSL